MIKYCWKYSVQFISVTHSCLTFCDPMDHSTPGLPVHHQLLELAQIHVRWVSDATQPSHPLSCLSSCQVLGWCKNNCDFTLLNIDIWHWNTFLNKCTYATHYFHVHFLLNVSCKWHYLLFVVVVQSLSCVQLFATLTLTLTLMDCSTPGFPLLHYPPVILYLF